MTIALYIPDDEVEALRQYTQEVADTFYAVFQTASDRFTAGNTLVDRFNEAIENVIRNGRHHFHAVDEAHNELCVAKAIIENPEPLFFSVIDYEPKISGCNKSIDFRAKTASDVTVWIDVKTIKPKRIDKWEHFQNVQHKGLLPENVDVRLSKVWLGGEIWHDKVTVRARMLEYAIELEGKIAQGSLINGKDNFVLFLCGEGFYWLEDELEDFVEFYRSGNHNSDDPFSKMEQHSFRENGKNINRTISNLACIEYSGESVPGLSLIHI